MAYHHSHFIGRCLGAHGRAVWGFLGNYRAMRKDSTPLEYLRWRIYGWRRWLGNTDTGTAKIIRFFELSPTSDLGFPRCWPSFFFQWLLFFWATYFTLDLKSFLPLVDSTDTISPKGFEEWSMKEATKHLKINCCNYLLNNFLPLFRLYILYMKGYVQPNQKLAGSRIYSSLCKKI